MSKLFKKNRTPSNKILPSRKYVIIVFGVIYIERHLSVFYTSEYHKLLPILVIIFLIWISENQVTTSTGGQKGILGVCGYVPYFNCSGHECVLMLNLI